MNFNEIFRHWKSPFITRNQLNDVTGGLIHSKTIRNLDCIGEGIKGKFLIGRRTVAYPTKEVVAWLENRYASLNKAKSTDGGKNA